MRPRTGIASGLAALLGVTLAAGCGAGAGDQLPAPRQPTSSIDRHLGGYAMREVRRQVAIGPRPSGSSGARRESALIVGELRGIGLRPLVQRPYRNVVVTIPGKRQGDIVVGAHYDTVDGVPGFVGANDGASGVAVLLELARRLRHPMPGPSVTLAFFDAEEARGKRSFESDGTRGSRQFVSLARSGAQGAPRLGDVKAMYLFDMVGDCSLQIPREQASDRDLYDRLHGPAFGGQTAEILDDHTPFVAAGIPSVDLIDFTYGSASTPGPYWHTAQDTVRHVCPASLGQVVRAMTTALGG